MLSFTEFVCKRRMASWFVMFILCPLIYGQTSERSGLRDGDSQGNRVGGLSELAKDNLSRVAASSAQIRTVLVKDSGLLVELKRWVAKEATDNGQIVQDSDLSDQAIFDRLDHDVMFRSVATRLVQRYGYLLPAPNPDSSYGKEEDLVLKERARRLVQIETQEDSESMKPQRDDQRQEVDRTTAPCNPQEGDCQKSGSRLRQGNPLLENEPAAPESTPQYSPDVPPTGSMPRTLRTDFSPDEFGQHDLSVPQIELTSGSVKSRTDIPFSSPTPGVPTPGDFAAAERTIQNGGQTSSRDTVAKNDVSTQLMRPNSRRPRPLERDEDVSPVKMVRPANPYADVPSLYDMYVQAAAKQKPTERFGMEMFRNTINQPDVIPMDLPVGPDYIVGTGDSLSIDLWGSVSQRLVRLVDREGRIALPETSPLLVTGKSLSEVQLDVQHALRSAFRDVSADVSLSRLRTVRVYVVGEVDQPGAYDISSLSTPLNALFAAGGVTPRGSLRALKHFRGKQLIDQVDAYDLLLHGIRSDLKRLENGDTLLVPPVGPEATVDGMVRRPAVYELLDESSLADVLELAGGILPAAALRHIEVQRLEAHEKRTMLTLDLGSNSDPDDVNKQLQAFKVQEGDQVHIFPIAPYNEDAIYLQGHVLRPGRYSYKKGMKVTDLITSYADLLPEPAPHYAELIRLNAPDF